MSEVAAPTAAPTPEANGTGVTVVPSLEERSKAAFDSLESAGEASPPAPDQASPAVSAEPDENAKARAERRATLERLRNEERAKVDAMAAMRERDELRKRLADYEAKEKSPKPANLVDVDALDEVGLLGLLGRSGKVDPHKLGEKLREMLADPSAHAAQAAKSAIDPEVAELKKQIAEQQEAINSFLHSQQQAQQEAEERHAAEQFYSFTRENATTSPYSARFLEKHGPEEFYKLAQSAVRAGAVGAQGILDEIEETLTRLSGIYTAEPANLQRRQATTPQPNPAAAKAPTHVTNTLAQQRSSVVDEDDFAGLTFEERSARVFG